MPRFSYTAYDDKGARLEGEIESSSREEAIAQRREPRRLGGEQTAGNLCASAEPDDAGYVERARAKAVLVAAAGAAE